MPGSSIPNFARRNIDDHLRIFPTRDPSGVSRPTLGTPTGLVPIFMTACDYRCFGRRCGQRLFSVFRQRGVDCSLAWVIAGSTSGDGAYMSLGTLGANDVLDERR